MPSADQISPPAPSGPRRLPPLAMVIGLFGVTLLAYFPALRGGLLWDDDFHVTAPALRSLHGLGQIWFHVGATQQYYPVLHSAFWLEHRLWGDAVLGYHLLNVGLHATAACLFALVLARLRPETDGRSRRMGTEWLAAAVFALHPVCVESVAWISEQKNTLSLVFYLLAALAYLRFDRDRQRRWYAVALGLFGLALLSKSVTATLPAALLLGFVWQRGHLAWRRDVVPLLPWFIIGAVAGLFTAWVERHFIGARGAAYDLSLIERCCLAGRVVWFYLGKLAWPSDLIFIYPRWQVGTDWRWSLGCLGLAAVFGALWRLRKWSPAPLLALLFFVGSLFPVLGFFNVYPFIFSYVADHWQYLPCLGIIALVSEGAVGFAQRLLQPLSGSRRIAAGSAFAAATGAGLALLFALTWRQCGIYRDVDTLYATTLARNPACWMAHNNLGLARVDAGRPAEGIAHFEQAIRLCPDFPDVHNNLGNALVKLPGRKPEAIAEFEKALQLEPDMPEAHLNLGWALVNIPGRLAEGISHLETVLRRDPDNPGYTEAHNNLGMALALAGRNAEAVAEFERVLRAQPDNERAEVNLGNALVLLGRGPEGIAHYKTALRLKPDSAEAHFNLGRALRNAGNLPAAITQLREAVRLAPRTAAIWNSLGSALYQAEQMAEAVTAYEEAVRLQPDTAPFRNNLGLTLTGAGRLEEAITQLRTAVRLAPGFADAHYNLGVALQQAGRTEEAAAEFKASGRAQP